jgi:MinD-like ATPase involved in chromosome partitioning or flagellar assembly
MTKIISTHSCRGGTGKSNVTANLAAQLALHGRRVAIVDSDLQSPGIHVLFRADPQDFKLTLNDYLGGRCRIEDASLDVTASVVNSKRKAVVAPSGGLFLVPASIKAGDIARIHKEGYDVKALNDGFKDLIESLALDYLLVDTHQGINQETLPAIALSDILILILRPDQQDYQGTTVALELLRRPDVPQVSLVVNLAPASLDLRALAERIAATYQTPVEAVLPLSEDMMKLGSGGLFSVLNPTSAFAAGMRTLADLIET